jgi:hypothetical protein
MMDRFRIAISIVGTAQIMIATALASQSVQPPIYTLPPAVAFGLVVVNAGLVFLAAQMPSWSTSKRVARAATAAEAPPRG